MGLDQDILDLVLFKVIFPEKSFFVLNRQPGEEELAGDAVTGDIDKTER